jgi:type VI secretion system secreted protein VgrG
MTIQAAISCEPLGACRVARVHGIEGINRLPRFRVDVLSESGTVDLAGLVGQPAALLIGSEAEKFARTVPLMVVRATYREKSRDGHRYALELSAPHASLTLRAGYHVFQEKRADQIVADVLTAAGLGAAVGWRMKGAYHERVYCVQYDETEWAFIERLLAEEGINYWFELKDDALQIVFGDHVDAHDATPGEATFTYVDEVSPGLEHTPTVSDLERVDEVAHDRVELRDYDVDHPDVLIEGKTSDEGAFEYYDFPASVPTSKAAGLRAQARLEQLRRFHVHARARSHSMRMIPGRVMTVEGVADEWLNGAYLIVEVEHELTLPTPHSASKSGYGSKLLLVPRKIDKKPHPFRPALPARRPRVGGVETAITTGAAGEEIHVNPQAAVKVRFHWDRSGVTDDHSSRWVRTLQPALPGGLLLPRVGWEVPVAYFDGNPDAPCVLGRLYNAHTRVPYNLPAQAATSTLQSATSPSDGTTQEFRMSDVAGAMEVFLHATRDFLDTVGGAARCVVGADRTHDVGLTLTQHIVGTQTVEITGNQTITVAKDASTKIGGARSETVLAMESTKVKKNRVVQVDGPYAEIVGAVYALEANQSNTVVQGAFMNSIGAFMGLTAGLGLNQTCLGLRGEVVGGSRTIVAKMDVADSTVGQKRITAGACTETSTADVVNLVKTNGTTTVNGALSMKAGGNVIFGAKNIKIEVGGDLTAKGGSKMLVASKVEVSGGTTKLDASTTKKNAKSEVES